MKNSKIMMFPSFVIIFGVTAYVFFNTLKESLGYIPELFLHKLTLDYYILLFSDRVFLRSILFSLGVAFISTALSTFFGVFLGYYISKKKNEAVSAFYKIPIFLSYIAAAILIYNTYSDKGVLYHIFEIAGFDFQNFNIIYSAGGLAVIFLYMFKGIPFMAISLYPILAKTDSAYREVAENLGCSNLMYVFKILLPICKRAILASSLIIFNYNLFSYEGFYYLGPSNPPSIGVMAYQSYISADMSKRAAGMAINMVMIIVSLILCFIYYKLLKKDELGREYENI